MKREGVVYRRVAHRTLRGAEVPWRSGVLERAKRAGDVAARVGFDWPDAIGALEKVREEVEEVEEAITAREWEAVREEVGDLLFSACMVARKTDVCAARALMATVEKFERRFGFIERALAQREQGSPEPTLEEMEAIWERIKRAERA